MVDVTSMLRPERALLVELLCCSRPTIGTDRRSALHTASRAWRHTYLATICLCSPVSGTRRRTACSCSPRYARR